MARRKRLYAVLTGDIVKSTALSAPALTKLRREAKRASNVITDWGKNPVRCAIEFTRGDEWQMALAEPALALRAAIFLRARLKAVHKADSRIAIGVGHVERFSSNSVFESTGEAFSLSGRMLDSMGQDRLLIILNDRLGDTFYPLADFFTQAVALCDAVIEDWTAKQAEYISHALAPHGPTHEEIAETMGATRQAAQKSLDAAHWRRLDALIDAYEAIDWNSHGR